MQSPADPPAPHQRWVPFAEALRILRTTDTTLRREIKAGRVQAERRRRNPDSATDLREVYEVLVTDAPAASAPIESVQPPDTRHEPPAATQALVDALADERAERQRLAAENAALRERVGRLEALAESRAEALIWTDERRVLAEASAERWHVVAEALGARADQVEQERRDLARRLAESEAAVARERSKPWWRRIFWEG